MEKKSKSSTSHHERGLSAEQRAVTHLVATGRFEVLARNYRTRRGEIDLILFEKAADCLVFVEVKSGNHANFRLCLDAISARKAQKIAKVAREYLENSIRDCSQLRFDAVFVERGSPWRIEHVENILMLA